MEVGVIYFFLFLFKNQFFFSISFFFQNGSNAKLGMNRLLGVGIFSYFFLKISSFFHFLSFFRTDWTRSQEQINYLDMEVQTLGYFFLFLFRSQEWIDYLDMEVGVSYFFLLLFKNQFFFSFSFFFQNGSDAILPAKYLPSVSKLRRFQNLETFLKKEKKIQEKLEPIQINEKNSPTHKYLNV